MTGVPLLGSGLGYREEIAGDVLAAADELDFVEVMTERYMWRDEALDDLRELADRLTVIPHGVGLSIGTAGRVNGEYLRRVRMVCDVVGAPFYSDHLAITQVPGIDLGHLMPVWLTEEVLNGVIDRVDEIQDVLGRRLILENVTQMFEIPGSRIPEPEFFERLVRATGCGVLFDVTNLYTNAVNHGFDAAAFMDAMPLDDVVQVHLAGGYWLDGTLIDSHSHPVEQAVWDLYARLCERADVRAVLIEHDQNFPDFALLIEQVRRARHVLTGAPERLGQRASSG
jgi:uncharacterized protein (UPF0276 family)